MPLSSGIDKAASTINHSQSHLPDTFSMTTKHRFNDQSVHAMSVRDSAPDTRARRLLELIGLDLDREIFPIVRIGGLVLPSRPHISINAMGKEPVYERETDESRRPKAGAWQGRGGTSGTTESSGGAVGPWSTSAATSLTCTYISPELQRQLNQLVDAYPETRVWQQEKGLWLFVQSFLLPGLGRSAGFVVLIEPLRAKVTSWGFWLAGLIGSVWIGPRHTNYGDGSICAFDQSEGTWKFGDSLVALVDIYSVWAVRHLHLETFGWWPGPQSSLQPYERLLEFADTEHCGCLKAGARYQTCCKPQDQAANQLSEACRFAIYTRWTIRRAPQEICEFVRNRHAPPESVC